MQHATADGPGHGACYVSDTLSVSILQESDGVGGGGSDRVWGKHTARRAVWMTDYIWMAAVFMKWEVSPGGRGRGIVREGREGRRDRVALWLRRGTKKRKQIYSRLAIWQIRGASCIWPHFSLFICVVRVGIPSFWRQEEVNSLLKVISGLFIYLFIIFN